jgi:hypothetical protein
MLADKPMIIQAKDFSLLEKILKCRSKRLVYDIKIERLKITNLL